MAVACGSSAAVLESLPQPSNSPGISSAASAEIEGRSKRAGTRWLALTHCSLSAKSLGGHAAAAAGRRTGFARGFAWCAALAGARTAAGPRLGGLLGRLSAGAQEPAFGRELRLGHDFTRGRRVGRFGRLGVRAFLE